MFTIKFYSGDGFRQRIMEAESFTILRGSDGSAEITLHQKNGADDSRFDIGEYAPHSPGVPPFYQRAIIENAAGKTTEMIVLNPRQGITAGVNNMAALHSNYAGNNAVAA